MGCTSGVFSMKKHHHKRTHTSSNGGGDLLPRSDDHNGFKSDDSVIDPLTGYEASLRAVQGYQATKTYICPECNDIVEKGSSHLVVVPHDTPDLRRHWHNYCWVRRQNRVPPKKKNGKKKLR